MLKLSKKVEYGLISVLHMASEGKQDVVATKELAGRYRMPVEILGKVLQQLVKIGILESLQGAMGGYRLRRPLEKISLGDIVEALDGPLHIVRCDKDPSNCEQFPMCNIREPALRVQQHLTEYMHALPLSVFSGTADIPQMALGISGHNGGDA